MEYTTSHILMVRPVAFGFNEQTAESNTFQQRSTQENVQQKALAEFDDLVALLRENKVQATVMNDTPEPVTPDSIFPNNWVSFHENGQVFLYPMKAPNRRLERNRDIIHKLKPDAMIQDLSAYETKNRFLEGTGSMVLDRVHKIAYACLSPRTDAKLIDEFCKVSGYRAIVFQAKDGHGRAIYHTNVMMCIGQKFAVICLEAIPDEWEKKAIKSALETTGHEIIEITFAQMNQFAGNMLEISNTRGDRLLILSESALNILETGQIERLEKYAKLISSPIPTIEQNGGGSVRCMMAEVF